MEFRLTVRVQDTGTVVHADGRLSRRGVGELEALVRAASGPVTFDLTNLFSADDAGVAALRSFVGRGVQLVGASPYITLLLEARRPGNRA